MDRRRFLTAAAVGAGALAIPTRVFAQASPIGERDRQLLDIARREIDRAGSVLWRRDIVGIADFGLHSSYPRFHFANIEAGTVRSYLVAHGTGSDPEHDGWLNLYSNMVGSNATSRGAYISWEWYKGKYGTSIRLDGLDQTNSNAFPRAIVMHSADYATQSHVDQWGKLGRSNGCFAMAPTDFGYALTQLSGGRLLYAESLGLAPNGSRIVPPAQPVPGRVIRKPGEVVQPLPPGYSR